MFIKKYWRKFIFNSYFYVTAKNKYVRIYRWNPHLSLKPWFNIYPITFFESKLMILDILFLIKNTQDSTLTFRRSCREGICGSCSMNINGLNTLACLKFVDFTKENFLTIYPLPHFFIIKDLISDLTNFYNQYRLIKPWLIKNNNYFKIKKLINENLQSKIDRTELDGLYECILCACCSASCPSYWWNYNKYLGPAILLQAYRWIIDSRDLSTNERITFLNHRIRLLKCHNIMNCSKTCPKNLNPAKAINELKYFIVSK